MNKQCLIRSESHPFVIPNEVRNLELVDNKRFLPPIEMTIYDFFDFCNWLNR